jgi:hypothetical protein
MGKSKRFGGLIWSVAVLSSALALMAAASGAHAATSDLMINNERTQNVSCTPAPVVCTPMKAGAILNYQQIYSLLQSGNVDVATGSTYATDIVIEKALSENTANTLTLDAYRSIVLNQSITMNGGGGLTLVTNDGGSGGGVSFAATNGYINFQSTASNLTINGISYTLINSLASDTGSIAALASAIASNPSGNYAFGASYTSGSDLTGTCTLIPTTFGGTFEGLGNAIKGLELTYDGSGGCSNFGLFASLQGGTIAHIRLFAKKLSCKAGNATDCMNAGALAASIDSASQIRGSFAGDAKLSVTTQASTGAVGGLVGAAAGTVINSATGSGIPVEVAGVANTSIGVQVGGLAGNAGSIVNSYAESKVEASDVGAVGGLAGAATSIATSYATGSVLGSNVQGMTIDVGGLVGQGGAISQSFATGAVSTTEAGLVGGLAGLVNNGGSIVESYAKGAVNGNQNGDPSFNAVGGLVGEISGCGSQADSIDCIDQAYETGQVSSTTGGNDNVGGLIGYDDGTSGALVAAYWDTTTSTQTQGVGNNASDPGVLGLTSVQLQSHSLPAGFSSSVWNEISHINGGFPYLLDNVP